MHGFRCPDDLWARGKAAADLNNETLTEALQRMLMAYVIRTERAQRKDEQ